MRIMHRKCLALNYISVELSQKLYHFGGFPHIKKPLPVHDSMSQNSVSESDPTQGKPLSDFTGESHCLCRVLLQSPSGDKPQSLKWPHLDQPPSFSFSSAISEMSATRHSKLQELKNYKMSNYNQMIRFFVCIPVQYRAVNEAGPPTVLQFLLSLS